MKNKGIISLIIFVAFSFFSISRTAGNVIKPTQTYKSFPFGKGGKLFLPSDWKIYDDYWNGEITRKAGFSTSKKKTIIRASDYTNTTMYIKLSSKLLNQTLGKNDIESVDFLDVLNEDLADITNSIKSDSKKKLIESKKAKTETFGLAIGGSINYTYTNDDGSTRKTIIYTMIKGDVFYNLTISWDINKKSVSENIANEIKNKIIFSN